MKKLDYVKPEMRMVLLESWNSILTTSPKSHIEGWKNGDNQLDF